MNINTKIFNKIQANQIPRHSKRITHHDQRGSVPVVPGGSLQENKENHSSRTEWEETAI